MESETDSHSCVDENFKRLFVMNQYKSFVQLGPTLDKIHKEHPSWVSCLFDQGQVIFYCEDGLPRATLSQMKGGSLELFLYEKKLQKGLAK